MKYRETLNLEYTISTPTDVTAVEVKKVLDAARWKLAIDLAFSISGAGKRVDTVRQETRTTEDITWYVEASATVELVPHEPLPIGHYSSSTTKDFIRAEPVLPDDWEIIEATTY